MKTIDKYLILVRQYLPLRGREDIVRELRSELLDEMEERFGPDPKESRIEHFLKDFGAPWVVAKKYGENRPVIAAGLADLYFLLLTVVSGALVLAFLVITTVGFIKGDAGFATVRQSVFFFFSHLIPAVLSAVGTITLGFIGVSRFAPVSKIKIEDEQWSISELKDVEDKSESFSMVEVGVVFLGLAVFLVVTNLFPHVITMIEDAALNGGIALSHRLSVGIFAGYMRILTLLWALSAVSAILKCRKKISEHLCGIMDYALRVFIIVLFIMMVQDQNLYLEYTGIRGFRLLFVFAAILSCIEAIVAIGKNVLVRILNSK